MSESTKICKDRPKVFLMDRPALKLERMLESRNAKLRTTRKYEPLLKCMVHLRAYTKSPTMLNKGYITSI